MYWGLPCTAMSIILPSNSMIASLFQDVHLHFPVRLIPRCSHSPLHPHPRFRTTPLAFPPHLNLLFPTVDHGKLPTKLRDSSSHTRCTSTLLSDWVVTIQASIHHSAHAQLLEGMPQSGHVLTAGCRAAGTTHPLRSTVEPGKHSAAGSVLVRSRTQQAQAQLLSKVTARAAQQSDAGR